MFWKLDGLKGTSAKAQFKIRRRDRSDLSSMGRYKRRIDLGNRYDLDHINMPAFCTRGPLRDLERLYYNWCSYIFHNAPRHKWEDKGEDEIAGPGRDLYIFVN
jgi:hypothetical protein